MSIYKRGIIYWIAICILSFLVYYLLWFIFDRKMLYIDGFSLATLTKEFSYCTLLSTLSLLSCHLISIISYFHSNSFIRISLLTIIIFTTNVLIAVGVEKLWYYNEPVNKIISIQDTYFFTVISMLISAIFISIHYCDIVRQKAESNNQLRRQLLKRQLDPHFLFNSLNTLAELIHENPCEAEKFTIGLSNIYRYILTNFVDDIAPIHDVIHFAREYFRLLESRYPGHFIIDFDPRLDNLDQYLLPLSLQQLIENAIKHNHHSASHPLKLIFKLEDGYIVVRNSLSPISTDTSNGIGLNNLSKRYQLVCNMPIEINNDGEYFEVKLPIINNNENTNNRR